jgi:death-on-curing protein
MDAILYLNKKMIVAINALAIDLSGGSRAGNNIRQGQNLGFVEQICYNELFGQKLYEDVFQMAAAYMYFIIKNHAFIDGNKRTGLAAAITFLKINNIAVAPFDEERVFDYVTGIASGESSKSDQYIKEMAEWLKSCSLY